jgi:dihydrofolate reductase
MEKIIIAAVSENGVIGKDGRIPWKKIPEDLRHFRELTMGFPMIMGKKTYQSIGKSFDRRLNLVLTKGDGDFNYYYIKIGEKEKRRRKDNITICHSIEEALEAAEVYNEIVAEFHAFSRHPKPVQNRVYIIGGGEIFRQTINSADKLELTIIDEKAEGNVYFPEINPQFWRESKREDHKEFSFVTYSRR